MESRRTLRGVGVRTLLDSLPVILNILNLAYPYVSSTAFRAFSCETFDGDPTSGSHTTAKLRADYSVTCDLHDARFVQIRVIALVAIALYPIGIPLLYSILLRKKRKEIRDLNFDDDLVRAMAFLYNAFTKD